MLIASNARVPPPPRRRWLLWLAGAMVGLLVVALLVVWMLGQGLIGYETGTAGPLIVEPRDSIPPEATNVTRSDLSIHAPVLLDLLDEARSTGERTGTHDTNQIDAICQYLVSISGTCVGNLRFENDYYEVWMVA